MTQVMFNFQYHKGIIILELKKNFYEFVRHASYFVESTAALNEFLYFLLKVCHSSAFQTISCRSVYIKIINYSDSISANLNNTIQTKEHAMKKPHSYSNRNKIY